MYEIEENVPMPSKIHRGNCKYPWRQMKVGDSFFVPCKKDVVRAKQSSLMSAAKRHDTDATKFISTSITTGEKTGVRVWLIERDSP